MSCNEYIVKEYNDGVINFFNKEMEFHRIGGPAVIYPSGRKYYYTDGKINRLDGPAVEESDGYKEYWIDGKEYSEADFYKKINPVKELTIKEISKLLGYEIKIVKE
jgi:hypothetical protein